MKYEAHRLLDHAVEADDRDLAEVISDVVTHLAWKCYMILVTFDGRVMMTCSGEWLEAMERTEIVAEFELPHD